MRVIERRVLEPNRFFGVIERITGNVSSGFGSELGYILKRRILLLNI
jgi:hypothetical protein